jgi:glutathione S-transferase
MLAYQYVECLPQDLALSIGGHVKHPGMPQELLEVNPEGNIPCIRHGNWAVWESSVMMEYLDELEPGDVQGTSSSVGIVPLLPPKKSANAQLRAHCRQWVDHVERKVLPAFYAVLLMPPPPPNTAGTTDPTEIEARRRQEENRDVLMQTLQAAIAKLVNASHATGPFFLGEDIGYVDVAFAPWIIRLSKVLERYRGWSNPDMGIRWQSWANAVESDERVRRTVCQDEGYHSVYQGVGEDGWNNTSWLRDRKKSMLEMNYARQVIRREGFGLGGDLYGRLGADGPP